MKVNYVEGHGRNLFGTNTRIAFEEIKAPSSRSRERGIRVHNVITQLFCRALAAMGLSSGVVRYKDITGNMYYLNRKSLEKWLESHDGKYILTSNTLKESMLKSVIINDTYGEEYGCHIRGYIPTIHQKKREPWDGVFERKKVEMHKNDLLLIQAADELSDYKLLEKIPPLPTRKGDQKSDKIWNNPYTKALYDSLIRRMKLKQRNEKLKNENFTEACRESLTDFLLTAYRVNPHKSEKEAIQNVRTILRAFSDSTNLKPSRILEVLESQPEQFYPRGMDKEAIFTEVLELQIARWGYTKLEEIYASSPGSADWEIETRKLLSRGTDASGNPETVVVKPPLAKAIGNALGELAKQRIFDPKNLDETEASFGISLREFVEFRLKASEVAPILEQLKKIPGLTSLSIYEFKEGWRDEHANLILDLVRAQPYLRSVFLEDERHSLKMSPEVKEQFLTDLNALLEERKRMTRPRNTDRK